MKSVDDKTTTPDLHVVLAAAYGYKFDWDGEDEIWKGHQMGFNDALRSVIDDIVIFVLVPSL